MRWLTVAVVLLSGCSLVFVRGPGRSSPTDEPRCTSTYEAPVVDTVLAAAWGGAVAAMAHTAATSDNPYNVMYSKLFIAAPISLAALYTTSAVIGFHRVHGCQHARDERMRWYRSGRTVPQTAAGHP